MGGMKTKISMEKMIEKKDSRAVAFSKRRKGLFSKTSQLCLLSGAQVAILATPVSSKSNASFYSFGHSSVDSVVSAFLANKRPRDDNNIARKGLGFWWEDESLAKSEDSKELSDAVDSISRMLQNLKGLRSAAMEDQGDYQDMKKKDLVLHGTHQDLDQNQTLDLPSTSASQDDLPASFEEFVKTVEEEDQKIVATSDNDNNNNNNGLPGHLDGCNEEFDIDQIFDLVSKSDSLSDNNNALPGDLYECNQDMDLDQITSFETNSESPLMNLEMDDVSMMKTNQNLCFEPEAVEDGALVSHRDLNEDNLHFSDFFSVS